jgi:hypothetical protein
MMILVDPTGNPAAGDDILPLKIRIPGITL